jgi:hypothetical protein
MFGEIISGLAEASVEGAMQASAPVTAEAIATGTSPTSGEGEVAITVEQLLALTGTHAAGAEAVEASDEGGKISVAPDGAGAGKDVLVAQEIAAALAAIEPLPRYRPIALPIDGEAPVQSIDRPEPEAMAVSDLPQIAQAVPVQVQPDLDRRQVFPEVPQPAPVGTRIEFVAGQALAALPQPIPGKTGTDVAAGHASADVPQPLQTKAGADFVARQAVAEVSQRAPARPRMVAAQAARADQGAPLPGSDGSITQAPQIASSRTEAVVQLAFSGLEAAVKAMPAQIFAAHSAAPAKRSGDTEPTVSLPELKLSTAMALPPIQPVAAAFEALRPLEAASIGTPSVPQPLDASELVIERQLDMAHEGEWLDQLARDITRSAGSDNSPLRFRLNPENLGSLRVEISQDRNGAAVRFTTDTEAARTIIAEAQPRLIAEARAQGIRISEAHVDLGGQTASGDPRRQNAVFEEAPLRTARSLQEHGEGDGKPTPGQSERYA